MAGGFAPDLPQWLCFVIGPALRILFLAQATQDGGIDLEQWGDP